MPPQPYALRRPMASSQELLAAIVSLRCEHLGNGGGFKQAASVEGPTTQVGLHKVAEVSNMPQQPSIRCTIDEEPVKGGIPVSGRAKDAPIHQEPSQDAHHTPRSNVARGDILILEVAI